MAPGLFSEDWPKPIIANAIDTIARDFAGTLAPLPSLNCASRAMRTDKDKRRAERKNKIGSNYWRVSSLGSRMLVGADHYLTYGFMAMYVEPDFAQQMPMIRVEDSVGSYYEKDRFGSVTFFSRCWREPAWQVAEKFPELRAQIIPRDGIGREDPDREIEVARTCDASRWELILPETGLRLVSYEHGLTRPPVVVAERPGVAGHLDVAGPRPAGADADGRGEQGGQLAGRDAQRCGGILGRAGRDHSDRQPGGGPQGLPGIAGVGVRGGRAA
jgi:hypothetical protein